MYSPPKTDAMGDCVNVTVIVVYLPLGGGATYLPPGKPLGHLGQGPHLALVNDISNL